jgi:hypothetical protein
VLVMALSPVENQGVAVDWLPGRLVDHLLAARGFTSLSAGQDDGAGTELATQVCMPALEAQLGVERS